MVKLKKQRSREMSDNIPIPVAIFDSRDHIREQCFSAYLFYQNVLNAQQDKTVGKGNKERDILVTNVMLKALKRYHKSLKLSRLPSPRESTLLITKNHGDRRADYINTSHSSDCASLL